MAKVKGICKNYDNCSLADKDIIQEVESTDFFCAECGKRLYEIEGKKPKCSLPQWAKILIAVVTLVGLIIGGLFLFKSCDRSKVRITVISSEETMGTVKGSGEYELNKVITIEAIPKEGYRFVSWDDKNTKNPREILAKEDRTYTARFEPEIAPASLVTITVESSNESMGTVRGGGTYDSFITISIIAIEREGYKFVSWNDGNSENPRKVITSRDQTFVAKFEKDPIDVPPGGGRETPTKCTIQYSFGKYVGECKNGIPEGDGKMYYSCRVQIAKHDTDNPAHFAEAGDWFDGTWGNGDIVSGALYSKDGKIKEKIFAPKRFNIYDLHNDHCLQ